ncbi:hypothetical protein K6754_23815 [Vibrio alginolyticus]|uniref:hypothetical protein n=1 Tax=Vibrio alginolyticus TaxID=663 RepID=UPI001EF05099|nr:hypothetical protein [Vibrio alginolyticus]EMC8460730.1 hypothetical protein [Vibrio alginolyticus]EME3934707.1 hypothetical protein [Vibrio alginolyticus]ULF93921.1 hypothetical protein K6754_23815 [Vibrio alginolyticus]
MKHEFNSETAEKARLKGLEVRRERAKERERRKLEVLELIKSKTLTELVEELKINVNIGNEVKQEVHAYLLKALIDVEVTEKAKHRFKIEQLFTKFELDELLKESPSKQDISINRAGEKLSIKQALQSGLIDSERVSLDDLNFLRGFVS